MTDALIARVTPEAEPEGRQPWARRSVAALVVGAALLAAFGLGLATAEVRATADGAAAMDGASTDLTASTGETAASAQEPGLVRGLDGRGLVQPGLVEPWLDAEFDFLGAVATWPSAPDATTIDPFRDASDASLVADGRTVCTRAGDRGMDADGMGDVLDTTPHQTYVLVTEAIDKLCPSQRRHLADLRS